MIGMPLLLLHLAAIPSASRDTIPVLPDSAAILPSSPHEGGMDRLLEHLSTEAQSLELPGEVDWLMFRPYDLNTVSADELAGLPGMSLYEATAVIELRTALRRFTSVEQLTLMEDRGAEVLGKLSPFVRVERLKKNPRAHDPTFRLRTRVARAGSGPTNEMAGSPFRVTSSLTLIAFDDVEVGSVFEKDPGERMRDGFLSGYLSVGNLPGGARVVVGDYTMESGQGLLFWRMGSAPKGVVGTDAPRRSAGGPRPHRSSGESNFLRGIAVATDWPVSFGSMRGTLFWSQRSLGANVDGDGNLTSLYDDGLFRTEEERRKRNRVRERLAGLRAELEGEAGWRAGVTLSRARLDRPVLGKGPYSFSGSGWDASALDAEYRSARSSLYGEVALSRSGRPAAVFGISHQASLATSISLAFRSSPPGSAGRYSWAFGEHAGSGNEIGAYIGWTTKPVGYLTLAGYLDCFRHPWRTAQIPLPSSGAEGLAQADIRAEKGLEFSVRLSLRQTETTIPAHDELGREVRTVQERLQTRYRVGGSALISRALRFKARLELTDVAYPALRRHERGTLVFEEIRLCPFTFIQCEARLSYFETGSYDSRMYESEGDLDGVFCNAMLFGKGKRWYALLRLIPLSFLHCSIKVAAEEKESDAGPASRDQQVSAQLEMRL